MLFDLDGTLVDSEQSWLDAVGETLAEAGVRATPATLLEFEGVSVSAAAERLVTDFGHAHTLESVERELELRSMAAFSERLEWLHSADLALASLRRANIPLGLVTSSTRAWVGAVNAVVDLGSFDVVVTADDVQHTKPHPAPYALAAQRLGVEPEACVAFEDSRVGVLAASAAGCHAVRVGKPRAELDALADAHILDFTELATYFAELAPHFAERAAPARS